MQSRGIIIITALVICCITSCSKKEKKVSEPKENNAFEEGSFGDMVSNPDKMPDLDEIDRTIKKNAAKIARSDVEIERLVNYYIFGVKTEDDAWAERRIIGELGAKAYPCALKILGDPAAFKKLVKTTRPDDSLEEAPIMRLCNIFDLSTPPPLEAATLLIPFITSESAEIRKSVALILGSIASPKTMPELKRLLSDEDEYVKSFTLMGIDRALTGKRIKKAEMNQYYDLVRSMWPDDSDYAVCDDIAPLLIGLNRERAIEDLQNPILFHTKFHSFASILNAFGNSSIEVSREKLLKIIEETNKADITYPLENVLSSALRLLGAHQNVIDRSLLEELAKSSNETISRGAINGLYDNHKFYDEIRNPRDVIEKSGWNSLTEVEKHICAIGILEAEVNNGGFAQYYLNSSGDHWQEAVNGLKTIGSVKYLAVMMETVALFKGVSPSSNRNERSAQLAKLTKNKLPFDDQDSRWYNIKNESLDYLIFKYNIANKEGRRK